MTNMDPDGQFSAFYRAHYSLVLATVARRLSDFATAQDVTSEVFRVAWARHVSGGELTLAWLYTVARNVVGNEYRRRSRAAALTEKAESQAYETHSSVDEEASDTRRAMMRLKDSDREILFMAYWEDLSGAEIASILDCKLPTVWVRLNRARNALKHELGGPAAEALGDLRERGASAHG
jgi:RNA polymerase sigma factor (sigma-70 family)